MFSHFIHNQIVPSIQYIFILTEPRTKWEIANYGGNRKIKLLQLKNLSHLINTKFNGIFCLVFVSLRVMDLLMLVHCTYIKDFVPFVLFVYSLLIIIFSALCFMHCDRVYKVTLVMRSVLRTGYRRILISLSFRFLLFPPKALSKLENCLSNKTGYEQKKKQKKIICIH